MLARRIVLCLTCVCAVPWLASSAAPADGRVDGAVAWSTTHLGSHAWDWYCYRFVRHCYLYGGGTAFVRGYLSAKAAATGLDAGANTGEPPRGAIAFYEWGTQGHAALSVGGGRVVHAYDGKGVIESGWRLSLAYIGWAWPPIYPPISEPPPPTQYPGCPFPLGSSEQSPWGRCYDDEHRPVLGPVWRCLEAWCPGPGYPWGNRQLTEHGAMCGVHPFGPQALWGGLLDVYTHSSWVLGWPTGPWQAGIRPHSSRGAVISYMPFQTGAICEISAHARGYWVDAPKRVQYISGDLHAAWGAQGFEGGPLGAPISAIHGTENATNGLHAPLGTPEQQFEGGYMTTLAEGKEPFRPYPYLWYTDDDPTLWWDDLGVRRAFRSWEPFCNWARARSLSHP